MGVCNSVCSALNSVDYCQLTARENMLMEAVRTKNFREVERLLKSNVNANSGNPLYIAVEHKDIKIVDLLLKRRADLNLIELYGTGLERYCIDSVMHAATCSYILERLLLAGGKINVRNMYCETPLMSYIRNGCDDCALYAISKGANTKLRDINGKTALDYARTYGRKEIIKMLS